MQSALALLVVGGAVFMLTVLGGGLSMFIDFYSLVYLVLFMYSGTTIAFGVQGLFKSITSLRFLFTNEIEVTPASQYLAVILSKQILFLYGGSVIGLLIGFIAIQSNMPDNSTGLRAAYAVNILVILYAALFAEGVLRPLSTKLSSSVLLN